MLENNEPPAAGAILQPHKSQESRLQRFRSRISQIDEQDAENRYREEAKDVRGIADDGHGTTSSEEERKYITFEPNDPGNPYNWSKKRKYLIIITTMTIVVNSTMASSLPSNAIPYMTQEWGITSQTQKVLPISIFLVGYVFGPIIWAPLSEQFGRKWPTIATFAFFFTWTLACALAPDWPAFLVFRLFVGVFASAPIAIVTGILADIYGDPQARGRAMAAFMATTVFGPLFAPIISGFCSSSIGWRWTFWIGLIWAGLSLIPLLILSETSGPIILVRRARQIRRDDPNCTLIAPHEAESLVLTELVTRVLTRPLRMLFTELIVSATCAYLALCYAIFYMTFQAYPIIFEDLYGLSAGVEGLCFLPIGAGALCALPVFYGWDAYLRKAMSEGRPWARQEEYRRLPLACVGGPSFVIALFWLGWTANKDIHFVVPMLSGIPFGMGFMLIFMAQLNYLTDAYEIYAASANAAASCSRSLLAVVLPFASTPMFDRLGIGGACSLLGGLMCLMCIIPFVFIWKGETLRAGSKFCIMLRKEREEMAQRAEKQRGRDAGGGGRREEAETAWSKEGEPEKGNRGECEV